MSATLDRAPCRRFSTAVRSSTCPAALHPIEIRTRPERSVAEAARRCRSTPRPVSVLCFLPGAPEIRRAMNELQGTAVPAIEILPLHGSLDADAQDRGAARRRRAAASSSPPTSPRPR